MKSVRSIPHRTWRLSSGRPAADKLRVWTIQPEAVWVGLNEQGTLLVDPTNADFISCQDSELARAYDWMRSQMAKRIIGYAGNYPWWAYEHFLDLRSYRWYQPRARGRYVRLGLDLPRKEAL